MASNDPIASEWVSVAIEVVHRGVGEHVSVVGQEHLVVAEVVTHPTKALADLSVEAGVDEGDAPVADVRAVQFNLATSA